MYNVYHKILTLILTLKPVEQKKSECQHSKYEKKNDNLFKSMFTKALRLYILLIVQQY